MIARPYQTKAVDATRAHWRTGKRCVLVVAPTGAGKTFLGQELISDCDVTLWVAHRRELVLQTVKRLRERFGPHAVGIIMPGSNVTRGARIHVGTVQTLLVRGAPDGVERIVLDEAHHYVADEWRALEARYPKATVLGLTATPERRDGEALGDVFQELVVAASYSELLHDAFLVPARVLQPPVNLGSDLAQDPIEAWVQYSEGSQTFMFCARVALAYEYAQRFRDSGIIAATVEADTAPRERDRILECFAAGKIRILTNVFALTEGVDVPSARTVMLARAFGHVGGFLQAAGRVLRPAPGKRDAIVIDLTGATLRHGLPTDDRDYSLDGRAISTGPERGEASAPEFQQRVRGVELRTAAPGASVPGAPVAVHPVSEEERRAEYARLAASGLPRMLVARKYFDRFGEWPNGGV